MIRVVVVDNSSVDLNEIFDAVQANGWVSWVTLVAAPKNGGFAYGNNLGLRQAYQDRVPDYVYLLNPDTEIRPRGIAALVDFLKLHPDVGIAGSSIENSDGCDSPIAFRFPRFLTEMCGGLEIGLLDRWEVAQTMSKSPQPVDWICGASMMIRPKVIHAIGGLDEHYFLYYEETDCSLRARQKGFATW